MSKQGGTRPADVIRQAKDKMDDAIAEAMRDFTQATGAEVNHVKITAVLAGMEVADYHIKSEVVL